MLYWFPSYNTLLHFKNMSFGWITRCIQTNHGHAHDVGVQSKISKNPKKNCFRIALICMLLISSSNTYHFVQNFMQFPWLSVFFENALAFAAISERVRWVQSKLRKQRNTGSYFALSWTLLWFAIFAIFAPFANFAFAHFVHSRLFCRILLLPFAPAKTLKHFFPALFAYFACFAFNLCLHEHSSYTGVAVNISTPHASNFIY